MLYMEIFVCMYGVYCFPERISHSLTNEPWKEYLDWWFDTLWCRCVSCPDVGSACKTCTNLPYCTVLLSSPNVSTCRTNSNANFHVHKLMNQVGWQECWKPRFLVIGLLWFDSCPFIYWIMIHTEHLLMPPWPDFISLRCPHDVPRIHMGNPKKNYSFHSGSFPRMDYILGWIAQN